MNKLSSAIVFISGILFGIGLAISGMTNPQKVVGFLDIFGNWDYTLAFVMGGALLTFATGLFILKKRGCGFAGCDLPDLSSSPVSKKLIIGSILFGVGWGLSGFCPGPALANLAAVRNEALIFVVTMAVGMIISQRCFKQT